MMMSGSTIIFGALILIIFPLINGEPEPASAGTAQVDYFQFMRNTYGKQNLTELAEEYGLKYFEQNFTDFMKKYNKQYADVEELDVRRSNFLYSLKLIKENEIDFKQGRVKYKMKLNRMADFGINEKVFINQKAINARFEQANKPLPFLKKSTFNPWKKFNTSTISFPTQFDWRSSGMVTQVEDQGGCGSGWIFASVGAIESANAIAGNPLVQLSKQQVLDCVLPPIYLSDGCNGGMIDDAFHYAKQVGLAMEKTYPYRGVQEKCQTMLGEWREWIFRYNYLPLNSSDEVIMWVIYNKGPVVAMVNAGDRQFQLYGGGVLTDGGDKGLQSEYNHYIQLVGWGNDNGLDYWLIKNSWGRDWGEYGYGRMIRGVNNRGINTVVAFAEALPIRQPEPPKPPPKPEPGASLMQAQYSYQLITFMLAFVIIYTIGCFH